MHEPSTSPDLSVLVMCYNEAGTLKAFVRELMLVLDQLPVRYEIVVINDGSTDETGVLANELAATTPSVRVVHHRENEGLGGVYRTGFRTVRGGIGTFFPADGQFPASILAGFVPLMRDYDLVLGYVTAPRPFVASALSRLERLLYRALFGRLPAFQGVMMFRRELLQRVQLRVGGRGWGVLMEFVIKCSRLPVRAISVPTPLRPRTKGKSKVVNIQAIRANLAEALHLRAELWNLHLPNSH
jgi:glycosyltransferase involved in cell wall biosynthesis